MSKKVVIMLDGGFVKIKLKDSLKRWPMANDIEVFCKSIMQTPALNQEEMLRTYYYDAPPHEGTAQNPLDGSVLNFSNSQQAKYNKNLISDLELLPNFAVRKGVLVHSGWKLGKAAMKSISKTPRPITANDFVPDISQKGVDMRIGLDIAWIALKKIADIMVLVTGDIDFIPAMKMARKEGILIFLETMKHPVIRELKVHADLVL